MVFRLLGRRLSLPAWPLLTNDTYFLLINFKTCLQTVYTIPPPYYFFFLDL